MPPSGLPVGLTQASLPARPTGRNYRPRGGSARRTGGPPRPGSIGRWPSRRSWRAWSRRPAGPVRPSDHRGWP